jgi:NAD-dependent SIR2 family protein deacetylase
MTPPDDLIQLAYSVYSSPHTYAVLLGSGVSRAAGIPTGWDITMDLIRKMAVAKGEANVDNPEEWYRTTYGVAPNYSMIIEQLASTQAERCSQLSQYFEPTPEDLTSGRKVPTKAHKAIAELVRDGYLKMIITTNFDQLMETALREQGVSPTIIGSDDALLGAMPYIHNRCTLVKVHGDYKDTRIRNTPRELEQYSDAMKAYLDRVLDDFGLVICGWSGEWDIALRNTLVGRRNRRFSTFWAVRGVLSASPSDLAQQLGAIVLPVTDADQLFTNILIKVKSLELLKKPHPMTVPLAIEETKIYLSEDRHRIRLHDMAQQAVEDAYSKLIRDFPTELQRMEGVEYQKRMHDYEELTRLPSSVMSVITHFDRGNHINEPVRALNRLLQKPKTNGLVALVNLQLYPAYLMMYSAGISALESGNFTHLNAILTKPIYTSHRGSEAALMVLNWLHIFPQNADKLIDIPNAKNLKMPVSDYMLIRVQEQLKPLIPDTKRLEDLFDIFEYLCGLTYVDLDQEKDKERVWGPCGRFVYKYYDWRSGEPNPMKSFFDDGLSQGDNWPLLKAGFFNGSAERFRECRVLYEEFLKKVAHQLRF